MCKTYPSGFGFEHAFCDINYDDVDGYCVHGGVAPLNQSAAGQYSYCCTRYFVGWMVSQSGIATTRYLVG